MMRYGLLQAGGLTLSAGGVTNLIVRLARQPTFVVGVLLYGVAAVVWFRVLSLAEVSSSYPVLIGLTFTLVTIGAILLFKESVSTLKVAGILVILAGIVLIAKGRA
jgi:multidrug transporter EmrE-like cation transporter